MEAAVPKAIYQPSKWGRIFHSLKVDEALGGGSAGGGKSVALRADPLEQIVVEHERCRLPKNHPDYHEWGSSTGWGLYLRRTLTMLDQTLRDAQALYRAVDPDVHWDAARLIFTFSSGYRMQFGHCKERDSFYAYYSSEYTWMGFDELVQFMEIQYQQLKTRVRSSDHVLMNMLKVRSMTNPVITYDGESFTHDNPFWVRDYFVEPYVRNPAFGHVPEHMEDTAVIVQEVEMDDGSTERISRLFLPARLKDNPNPDFARKYERQLRGQPKHLQDALLRGDWYTVAGAFYSEEWNSSLHVCEPFRIPREWYVFRSMDWGYKKPGCIGWYALDPDGTLWKFHEYTFQKKTDEEVSLEVERIERRYGLWKGDASTITGPADTQLWEQRGESAKPKNEVFADNGITWERADKKSRQANAERLMKRLKDHNGGTTTPGLVVFRQCVMTIRTIPSIPTDPNNPECPMDGGEDHWHDETLYACAWASREDVSFKGREEDDDGDGDFDDDQEWGRGYGEVL